MIGQRIHHYQIIEKLGEGGMGVVYRAYDTRLDRTVALKFLHPAIIATPEDQQRLVQEARAAAGLSHPNICTIHEINEIDGRMFIAMQFVEGTTLRDRVLSGRIDTVQALRHLLQIADGLKQAHEKGIVHRDMKSSNIMITPTGRAVIMDFGLARPVEQGRIDERFSSRGTSAYMSPEQARGEAVDQRTDIWSLGVVLYEMLAGQLPFRGDYEQAVIYSILNETHRPIDDFRQALPASVKKILARCLAKNPADRFQSLDALIGAVRAALDDLTGVRRGAAAPGRLRLVGIAAAAVLTVVAGFVTYDFLRGRSAGGQNRVPIAVIDFDNDTDEPALDGLSGMLITGLEQSRRLSVMTRTRMLDVLKTLGVRDVARIDESLGQRICEAAGVDVLVIPTVRRFGDLYSIDLKVLDTRRHKYVYTKRLEGRGQESIPDMIDTFARDIRIDLPREESEMVARSKSIGEVTTQNLEAYQAYFRGEERLNDLDFPGAARSFESAIERDSSFALAYYRLAYTEWWSRGRAEEARKHIAYAIDNLDRIPLKERYLVRALKAALDDGFEAQLPVLKEMKLLYPYDKEMLFGLGDAEFHSGQLDSAEVHFKAALAVDPAMDRALQHLTWTYMQTYRYTDAQKVAERWVEATRATEAYENLAGAWLRLGDADRALALLQTLREREPGNPRLPLRMASMAFAMENPRAALAYLDEAARLDRVSPEPIVTYEIGSVRAAVVFPYTGRLREAFVLLDRAQEHLIESSADSTLAVGLVMTRAALEYWCLQDTPSAIETLDAIADWSPRLLGREFWRAKARYHVLDGDTAVAHRIVRERVFDMPEGRLKTLRALEVAYFGDCERAAQIAADAADDPGYVKAADDVLGFHIAQCLVKAGDHGEAIRRLRTIADRRPLASELAPMYPVTWLTLGEAYEKSGQTARASESYRKVLDMLKDGDPDLPPRRAAEAGLDRLSRSGSM